MHIYGRSEITDTAIEVHLLQADASALARQLHERIQQVKQGEDFIGYQANTEFSVLLDTIIADMRLLIDTEPKLTFELADSLLATHQGVFERSDDSGCISMSYHEAVGLWLQAASRWRASDKSCRKNWPADVIARHQDKDYGVWDTLIAQSGELLTNDELSQLARHFEAECKQALQAHSSDAYNSAAAEHAEGMMAVAEALVDAELYERSVLITSPAPTVAQKILIIRFCLKINAGEMALKWLASPWDARYQVDQNTLYDKILQMMGRTDALLRLRRSAYADEASYDNLTALLELLPEEEQVPVRDQAEGKALLIARSSTRIHTLISLQAFTAAAEQIVQLSASDNYVNYYTVPAWAKQMMAAAQYLAASHCYRRLLDDILDDGRSKAYHYAAQYYRNLEALDKKISLYQGQVSWSDYRAGLLSKHGRKRAFWGRVT